MIIVQNQSQIKVKSEERKSSWNSIKLLIAEENDYVKSWEHWEEEEKLLDVLENLLLRWLTRNFQFSYDRCYGSLHIDF